jgi:hypothetical protein
VGLSPATLVWRTTRCGFPQLRFNPRAAAGRHLPFPTPHSADAAPSLFSVTITKSARAPQRYNHRDPGPHPARKMNIPKVQVPYLDVEIDFALSSTQMLVVTVVALVIPTIYVLATYDSRRRKMPPYVRGWPILNQTLDHLSPDLPLYQQRWHRKYGDIYCTKSGATTFIWLSSPRVVKDLIDRRSAIYSSRPPLPLTNVVLSGGKRVAFMPRNNVWR